MSSVGPVDALRGAGLVGRRLLQFGIALASAVSRSSGMPTTERARLRAQAVNLGALGAQVCAIHGVRVVVRGARPSEPSILVANHLGYLDPLAIASVIGCSAIGKQEIDGWPFLGASARELGIIFVRRGSVMSGARALRMALRRLRQGISVLNFPEGTTTYGASLLPLSPGIFGLARVLGVPVVPVRVDFDDPSLAWVGDDALVPHYVRFASKPESVVRLRFDRALSPSSFKSVDALVEAARECLSQRMRPS